MKLSKKKENEIAVWEYFIPSNCAWAPRTDKDIVKFFEWSERGMHKDEARINTFLLEGRTYFHALVWGKKWAMIHVHELWENDTQVPWFEILERLPAEVREWVTKEAGLTKEKIDRNTYDFIMENSSLCITS